LEYQNSFRINANVPDMARGLACEEVLCDHELYHLLAVVLYCH